MQPPVTSPQMPQQGAQGGMPMPPQGMMSQAPQGPVPPPPEQPDPEADYSRSVKTFLSEVNIADHLSEKELADIGKTAYEGYKADLASRAVWEENLDVWTKLALQVREVKTFPWPKASNVKFPLLSTAAMQFSARAYPTLIPSNGQVVKAKVIGFDKSGQKAERAERVGRHMSYQVMNKMVDWEDDMDRLLMVLPIVGTCFKKTYYDSSKKENASVLVLPKDLVVNYWTRSLESCERKTERMYMSPRLVKERQLAKIWLDVDLPKTNGSGIPKLDQDKLEQTKPTSDDEISPYLILEQHTFLELDDDDYPEPYIVTFEAESQKVLRITARFDDEGVETDEDGKVVKITPVEYYTKYGFIPNPDGGFYDLGFGLLLGTLNESVNTIINQLVDAGTLSNLQSGFIAKGLRIKMGEARFTPGEWKSVNSTAEDLHKQIVPLPVRDPSNVLFELLGTLIQASKELASVAEIFVGKMPGQNTPATTTMASIEQGMKVFTAIYKRIFRSLDKEFKKLYRLNRIYLDPKEETNILDVPVSQSDYDDTSYDICPAADPEAVSQSAKVAKFQAITQMMPYGTLDPMKVTLRGLDALEIPDGQDLIRQGPPPPDPKQVEMQQKAQMESQKAQVKMQSDAQKAELDQHSQQTKLAMDGQMKQQDMQFKQMMGELDLKMKLLDLQLKAQTSTQDLQHNAQANEQSLRHDEATHQVKVEQMKKEKPAK